MDICDFKFSDQGKRDLENFDKGRDWPVVYMIYNSNDIYIGETTSASTRLGQHLVNPTRQNLQNIKVVFDDTYNKSVILDYEQKLIKCFKADGKFKNILNKNAGQSSQHDYYEREKYTACFDELWRKLFSVGMVQNSLDRIENDVVFKYSPYNSLTEEQNSISTSILKDILDKMSHNEKGISLVNGCAGTGKTVLAISMINSLVNLKTFGNDDFADVEMENEKTGVLLKLKEYVRQHGEFKLAIVFPMTGIRKTISLVFKEAGNGLTADMVVGPNAVKNNTYDILFVDEAHRLARRKNLGHSFKSFDTTCRQLGLDPEFATQLDWVLSRSKYTVLFYDRDQSIKSSDVLYEDFVKIISTHSNNISSYTLTTQMRCKGGRSFVDYVKDILHCNAKEYVSMGNGFEFVLYDDVQKMVDAIKAKDNEIGLCKTVAGYAWDWERPSSVPKNDYSYYDQCLKQGKFDIDIHGHKFMWNFVTEGWLNRLDSHDTIGCIHSTQGLDLNYVGVIFGKEIDYNPATGEIEIDLKEFCGQELTGCGDYETKKKYILNTYTTLLARGIKGCYVYACNPNMQAYLHRFIKSAE